MRWGFGLCSVIQNQLYDLVVSNQSAEITDLFDSLKDYDDKRAICYKKENNRAKGNKTFSVQINKVCMVVVETAVEEC